MTQARSHKKLTHTYYVTVEGETEKWYLEWLRDQVNACKHATGRVAMKPRVCKDPLSYAKGKSSICDVCIYHLFDFESEYDDHPQRFSMTLQRMNQVENLGRGLKCESAYSNFTFEIWLLLHKSDARSRLSFRHQYLGAINTAFGERFESLDEYKEEANFKRVLSKLSLDEVKDAVIRAKAIDLLNKESGCRFGVQHGYRYCRDNPATDVWKLVERIFKDAGMPIAQPFRGMLD